MDESKNTDAMDIDPLSNPDNPDNTDTTVELQGEASSVYAQQARLEAEQDLGATVAEVEATTEATASEKARAYIAKKKAEACISVQATFADQMQTYEAVRHANNRTLMAPNLNDGEPMTCLDLGSFFSTSDGRMAANRLSCNYSSKLNTSCSFDVPSLRCRICKVANHTILQKLGDSSNMRRTVVMLGDQSLPACLPGSGEADCVPMMRLETANLKEIANQFLALTAGYKFPAGSVVVISSSTQLATGDLGEYLRDMREISSWFLDRFREEVEVVPGPPFLLTRTDCPQLI